MSPNESAPAPGILRRLANEMAKFGVVGIVGVVIQMLALTVLLDVMPGATVRANIIATLIAIGTNYIGYRYWVYRDADAQTRAREITLFLIFSGFGLVIQNAVLYALTYGLDLHQKSLALLFTMIGIGVATLFRFWAYRTFVFTGAGSVTQAEQILAEQAPAPAAAPAAQAAPAEQFGTPGPDERGAPGRRA
ncbi:GtrA family protein [Streptacidiphilus sp. PB12-B1b]|uniref:GtrA family protein n=1 Tax=Streptacidiphilus sp. PB12-B1b TaxID=2705012 RepID=UPI0015FB9B2D|nr:GtrA family protein [Streptacidiphilus sp. PB12-B1b]QMU75283.1 GtrA family protein [Streptacidiphilus sp. PB12-B1b]